MNTTLPRDEVRENLLLALEQQTARTVYSCYQCGKCSAMCPFEFQPQRVMRYLQLGQIDLALSTETTWVCASCQACSRVCPKDADPAGVMKVLREVRSGLLAAESLEGGALSERDGLTELAAENYRRHSHPLRAQFFANIHHISRRGSRMAPVSNWLTKVPGSKLVAHHLIGVHKERSLPEFVRPSFPDWFRTRQPLTAGHHGEVVLFHDTFMDYDAPSIGVSATELLELAGYRVQLSDSVCCGRPMISKGFVDKAREQARINVERLHRQLGDGVYVVGCEPSCLLTIREEYPKLLAGGELEEKARRVAKRCLLIDEFLARVRDEEKSDLIWNGSERPEVLFHGHCQQKAEADPTKSLELLREAGFEAEMVVAPCCGMAGAFGFEREHYEASKRAFQRALGPAIEAHPDARIAVMGISCRKQIEHFAGRQARHVVELLREASGDLSDRGPTA